MKKEWGWAHAWWIILRCIKYYVTRTFMRFFYCTGKIKYYSTADNALTNNDYAHAGAPWSYWTIIFVYDYWV